MERSTFTDESPTSQRLAFGLVGVITLLALVVRLFYLGDRVAHWDEARVGFWILDFIQTGNYSYSPVIHGPFYHIVNPVVFDLLGQTDRSMRLVPAIVSGLLPAAALLFRKRLNSVATVVLAAFLAFDPLLVYYGRFMRGDPLVATFMFVAFGCFVWAYDTDDSFWMLVGTAFVALGCTTKENALIYLLCWVGALALVFDQRLLETRARGDRRLDYCRSVFERTFNWLGRHGYVALLSIVEFFAIIIFFYGERKNGSFYVSGENGGYVGLDSLLDPGLLVSFLSDSTAGIFMQFYNHWGNGSRSDHAYLSYLVDLLETISTSSMIVLALSVVGFVVYRYTDERDRPLLTITFAWGVVSLLGYPIFTDIKAPWAGVHVVLPLMVPAAAGASVVYQAVSQAISTPKLLRVGTASAVVVLLLVPMAVVGVDTVYERPTEDGNPLVQYAQPADDLHPTLYDIEQIGRENPGTDVLVYGTDLSHGNDSYQQPSCLGKKGWFDSLPLPWYFERSDLTVTCARSPTALSNVTGSPPVVIARADTVHYQENNTTVTETIPPEELTERYPSYEVRIKQLRTTDTKVAFLFDPAALNESNS